MKKKEIMKMCGRIYEVFNGTVNVSGLIPEVGNEESPFTTFFNKLRPEPIIDNLDEIEEALMEYRSDLLDIAFSFGYTMGTMVEPCYPSVQKDVRGIRGVIKIENLQPYLPRERKAQKAA